MLPQNKKICVVVSSTDNNTPGKIAFVLSESAPASTSNGESKISYPMHNHVKILRSLYDHRMAYKSNQSNKQTCDWDKFSSLIEHTQNLIKDMRDTCSDIDEHNISEIHVHIGNASNLKFWNMDSISLPNYLQKGWFLSRPLPTFFRSLSSLPFWE